MTGWKVPPGAYQSTLYKLCRGLKGGEITVAPEFGSLIRFRLKILANRSAALLYGLTRERRQKSAPSSLGDLPPECTS